MAPSMNSAANVSAPCCHRSACACSVIECIAFSFPRMVGLGAGNGATTGDRHRSSSMRDATGAKALTPSSRSHQIAYRIDFPDYALDELDDIGKILLRAEGYTLTPEAKNTFREYLKHRKDQPRFANARSVRNAIERARLRHASRLMTTDQAVGRHELTTLTPDEFLGSRVFTDRNADNA